jgi:Protein of unknown function (DUF1499)
MKRQRFLFSILEGLIGAGVIGLSPAATSFRSTHALSSRRECFTALVSLPFVVSSAAALPCWAEEFATSAGRKGCTTASDPSKTTVTCFGELANVTTAAMTSSEVRLKGIASTENGVSTSAVKNPARYTPPWSYITETSDPAKAWTSLKEAVQLYATIVDEVKSDKSYYLHAVAPTTTPPGLSPLGASDDKSSPGLDDLEFVLRPNDNLVLYRSASRTAVFVYPLTQPVRDGGTNLDRLEKIRDRLGWQRLE